MIVHIYNIFICVSDFKWSRRGNGKKNYIICLLVSNYLEKKEVFGKWILGEKVCKKVALLEEFIETIYIIALWSLFS